MPTVRELDAPRDVVRIARVLERAGFRTWAVGGAVRDALVGLHPGDWDLTTSARPGDVRRLFPRTVPVGIEHGTVGVLGKDGRLYEVTTFRRDVENFGRHARVRFADTLEDDLERRDFTINAVAWHPLTRELRDPHGGMADLDAGILRTVGEAAERFAEDRLRVLRALRFAGRFSLRIEPETWAAIRAAAGQLDVLSAERIREELYKTLQSPRPSAGLDLYRASGVLASLYPELDSCVGVPDGEGDLWAHLLHTVDAVPVGRTVVRLAALFHDLGRAGATHDGHAERGAAAARSVMRRLKASNADTDTVVHLVAQHAPAPSPEASAPRLRRWARTVGSEHLGDLFRLLLADRRARTGVMRCPPDLRRLHRRVHRLIREGAALAVQDLAIGGSDLRGLGIPPGPLYGEILRDLLERVTEEPELNDRERLISIVRERIG